MGASAGGQGRGQSIVAINMVPLIDIMLVLLVILMVVSQVVDSSSLPVTLPRAADPERTAPPSALLTLGPDGSTLLDGRLLDRAALARELSEAVRQDTSLQIVLAADRSLPYQRVVEVLDLLRREGIRRYALKVEPSQEP